MWGVLRHLVPTLLLLTGAAGAFAAPSGRDRPRPDRSPHVILLVLDELPGDTLLGRGGRIDVARYPGFARLASHSTWFPDASTASAWTSIAIPSIFSGRLRPAGVSPPRSGDPQTLFGVLAGAGYQIIAGEETTTLCQRRLCARRAIRAPTCRKRHCLFIGRGRIARFRRWLATIRPRRRPTLWVKHLLLPHRPWLYLPSGLATESPGRLRGANPGLNRQGGPSHGFLRLHNLQRYLLQLRFTDRLIGALLDELERRGMLSRAMLVVTADHGYSFAGGGGRHHRAARAFNVHEIAPVPLFVKTPGQRVARIEEGYASTLDVTPTVAAVVGARLRWPVGGTSLLDGEAWRRSAPTLLGKLAVTLATYERRRTAGVARRLRLFGSGQHGFWDGIGPNRQLVGRHVSSLPRRPTAAVRAKFVAGHRLLSVRRASRVLPSHLTGHLQGGRPHARRELAAAVNGRIEAVGRSFYVPRDPVEHFALMVRPSSLHEGRNRVELLEVRPGPALRPLGRAGAAATLAPRLGARKTEPEHPHHVADRGGRSS